MSVTTKTLSHGTMPRFVTWVQDNLLLTLLILASGFVNGIMMLDGWVKDVESPGTWGFFHTVGVVFLFAAGLGLGGLGLRVSYKLSECIAQGAWGRVVFLTFATFFLCVVEFWASFSQRALNIAVTPADNMLASILHIQLNNVSPTAFVISLVVPVTSLVWGFAAGEAHAKPVEDAETLRARLANEAMIAEHKRAMRAASAKGLRSLAMAAAGKDEAPEPVVEQEPEGDEQEQEQEQEPVSHMPPEDVKDWRVWALNKVGVKLIKKAVKFGQDGKTVIGTKEAQGLRGGWITSGDIVTLAGGKVTSQKATDFARLHGELYKQGKAYACPLDHVVKDLAERGLLVEPVLTWYQHKDDQAIELVA